ncbi:MAG: TolC family protein [Planctomycetota bacterium]|nr:TolC family protein [Planctomycetota bacterium]
MKETVIVCCLVVLSSCSSAPPLPSAGWEDPSASRPPPGRSVAPARDVSGVVEALIAFEPQEGMTLQGAFELAQQSHPELAAAQARVAAAAGRALDAGRLPNPAAVLRIESAPFEGATLDEAEYVAGVSQPLPLGGRLAAAERVAAAEVRRAVLERDAVWFELRGRIRGAFASALYAQKAAELRSDLLEQAEAARGVAAIRVASGDATEEGLLTTELAIVEARRELLRADGLRSTALGELALAVGTPEREIATVTGDLDTAASLPAIEDVLRRIEENPVLLAQAARVEADEARLVLAAAQRIPDLRLDLLYRRLQETDANAFDVGLSVPLQLFTSGRGRVEAARADLIESQARRRGARARIESSARIAHDRLVRARAELELVEDEVLPRSAQLLAIHERRFEAGDIALDEVLRARVRHASAELSRLEAFRATMAAWAELAPHLD